MEILTPPDICFRCGYDLRTLADDQPCSECGLLAIRSRRPTDALHDTRPGWLRRLSWGVWVILLAILVGFAGMAVPIDFWRLIRFRGGMSGATFYAIYQQLPFIRIDAVALILPIGVFLLTTPEGYPPADQLDRRRRVWLRRLVFLPLLILAVGHVVISHNVFVNYNLRGWYSGGPGAISAAALLQLTLAAFYLSLAPLPLLLFMQLRSLAKRARSAHLAEHCVIVGIGNSATLLYLALQIVVAQYAADLGLGAYWSGRSQVALAMVLILFVASTLFAMWNVYLLIRFALAFGKASRNRRSHWAAADRMTGVVASA